MKLEKKCSRCGEWFQARTNAKYCETCRPEVKLEQIKEYQRRRYVRDFGVREECTCDWCGRPYVPKQSRSRFRSPLCRQRFRQNPEIAPAKSIRERQKKEAAARSVPTVAEVPVRVIRDGDYVREIRGRMV